MERLWWIACAKRTPSKSRMDYNPILLLFPMVRVVKVRQNQRVSAAHAELIILTFVYLTRLGACTDSVSGWTRCAQPVWAYGLTDTVRRITWRFCWKLDMGWQQSYLVDPASSHMLVSKIKPCMSKYKQLYTVKLRTAHYISNNLFDGSLLHG